ncbi:MAG: DUF1992 domain-containing protein [Maritimibacter sp.]
MGVDFSRMAERKMLAALAEGKLSHLPGEGKPLPTRLDLLYLDPIEALGFRLMREAGMIPKELELNKQRHAAREAWQAASDEERDRLMPLIADLDMRYNIAHEARLHLMKHH